MNCKDCIINIGRSGNDIVNELDFLKKLYQENVTANTVLLNINSSDINDLIYRSKYYNINIKRPSMVLEFFYGSSFIFRYYSHNVLKLNYNLITPQQQEKFNEVAKKKIFEYIMNFDEFCKKNNTKLIVVFQPMLWEIENNTFELYSVIQKIKQENIAYIDASNFIETNSKDYYWPIDLHFNDKGYKVYSEYLYRHLVKIDF